MSDLRPNPTEPSDREEQIRDLDCAVYDSCLDTAVRSDWRRFTCARCPLYVPESARRTEAVLRPLQKPATVTPLRVAPSPPPKEQPMPVVPAEPQSAFERARARQRRVAELEEQLGRERELLRADLAEAEKEMAELRGATGAPPPMPKGLRGGQHDAAILAAARERPVTPEEIARRLGLVRSDVLGQRFRQLTRAGVLRKVAHGLYEAA